MSIIVRKRGQADPVLVGIRDSHRRAVTTAGKDRLVGFRSLDLIRVTGAEVSTWPIGLGSYDQECLEWPSGVAGHFLDLRELQKAANPRELEVTFILLTWVMRSLGDSKSQNITNCRKHRLGWSV